EGDGVDGEWGEGDDRVGGIDEDAVETARHQGACLADAVVDDADRLRDGDRAIAAGIEHGDLAGGKCLVMRRLEGAAWGGARTVISVGAGRRDKGARELRLRRTSADAESEQNTDSP